MQRRWVIGIFIFIAFIATVIPVVFTVKMVGGTEQWGGVLPRGTTDSLYYYARIHEVLDGHPLIGHPYIYEYQDSYSPIFFLPDILSALPLFLGIPFNVGILINIFLWTFVCLMCVYVLTRLLGVHSWWAIVTSIFFFVGAYSFMLRPTVMQTIFPLYLLFLVSYLHFLYDPFSKRKVLWLGVVSALTFYFYSYLAIIAFWTLAVTFVWFLFSKQFHKLRVLSWVGVYTVIFLIPFAIYTYLQTGVPFYTETLERIGLVYTRIPTLESFFYIRWVIIGAGAWIALWFCFPNKRDALKRPKKLFWVTTGIGLSIALFMNTITGMESTFAIHIGRFVTAWMLILLGVFLHDWYFSYSERGKLYTYVAHVVISFFVLLLLVGAIRNIPRALAFFDFGKYEYSIAELQSYGEPLRWLDMQDTESVIWSNQSLGEYIPILTKHYTLFNSNAVLLTMSNSEIEERYLLWRSLERDSMTSDDLRREFEIYAGAGPFQEQPLALRNRVRFCNMVLRHIGSESCPLIQDALSLRGDTYFDNLAIKFEWVEMHQAELLEKYHVAYILIDTKYDRVETKSLPYELVYDDGRFSIFRITDSVDWLVGGV